ncbi:unnamed protein product [Parnassius apollo]|uniref:(apollo) hypothetical protein n=1 Tax=Parnassius apollo TaxID=110799 RepID=A0A8S3WNU5_PARAO|nr:unnamed protein product [Parnassius apollo]
MDSRLYDTVLANHKIFEDLKEGLQESSSAKLHNLIELKDDVLYAWNSIENCLFSVNVKHLEEHPDETPYQVSELFYKFSLIRYYLPKHRQDFTLTS